jgi:hypothetical protein
MIDHLLRDLQMLRKADAVIAKIWLNIVLRRAGLTALAGLIAVFGLAMANVAGFYALQAPLGSVGAATIVALVDLAIAAIVLLVARKTEPGPELDIALDVRQMAVDSIQADARDLKLTVEAIGQEVKAVKANVTQLLQNPLDTAAQKLLIPAALAILRGVRSKKEHA